MVKKSYARKTANKNLIYASILLVVLVIFAVFIGLYIAWMFSFRDRILLLSGIVIGTYLYYMLQKILQSKFLPRWGKYKGFRQGEAGETAVIDALKKNLGKGNLIVNDVVLKDNTGNIDHIVIGQYGVFVIETKTYRGRIVCDGDNWFSEKKIGEKTVLIKLNYSPSKQAKSNAVRLSSFLKDSYPKLKDEWIWAIVVFPNKQFEGVNVEIKTKPKDCEIFDSIAVMIEEMKKEKISIALTYDDLSQLESIFMSMLADTKIIN
jgi:hypothetical protein